LKKDSIIRGGVALILSNVNSFKLTHKTIVDIGANDGTDSVRLASAFPNSMVYSFEPVEKLKGKRLPNIRFHNLALGDYDGVSTFYSNENSKVNSLFYSKYFKSKEIQVPISRMDTFAKNHNIGIIDIVWIDAQQGELKVLKGFGSLLKDVSIIYTEVCYKPYYENGVLYRKLRDYIEKRGFIMVYNRPLINSPHGSAIFINKKMLSWSSFYKRQKVNINE